MDGRKQQWKAKSPGGCMFIFVGNMYPTKFSILRKLKKNPTWIKFIAGGILADGTSLWEDLQPIKQLMTEFENDLAMGHPEIFYSEVLNDENASANNLIDLSALPDVPFQDGDIPGGNFVIVDPSNDKANSDYVAIGYFEVHDGKPCLMELTNERLSPGDICRTAIQYCLRNNCRIVAYEANAFQYSLLYWHGQICTQIGVVGIEAVDIYSGSSSKNSRILTMLKAYAAGEHYISDQCKLEAHTEIAQFNPLRTDNVDNILDLLCYGPRVMVEFEEYVVYTNLIEQLTIDHEELPLHNTNF